MKWTVSPFRTFLDGPLGVGELELPPDEARHLAKVRRLGTGDRVTVLNGRGQVGDAVVAAVDRRSVDLDLREVVEVARPARELVLAVGALKPSAWEEVLVHAVELGVTRLFRVQTAHAVSDPQGDRMEAKRERWREKMIQACKQSVNPWLPEVEVAESVEAAVRRMPAGAGHVFADLASDGRLSEVRAADFPHVVVWVGPEGDFSEAEREVIAAIPRGVRVSLGPRILRAETAALALVSALRLGGGRALEDIADFGRAVENIG